MYPYYSPTLAQLEAMVQTARAFARAENRTTPTKEDIKRAADHHAPRLGPA